MKKIIVDKVRDHCHLVGENRGPLHSNCNINVKQAQSILYHLHCINSVTLIVIYFFEG